MSHGGDIYRNKVNIDLSVSVNPLGCPESVNAAMQQALSRVEKYPDIKHERLIGALSGITNIPADNILLGNGASELLMTVMRYFAGRKVFLPVPSFTGYRYAAEAAGCEIVDYPLLDDIRNNAAAGDVIVFATPNNPTGRLVEEDELRNILSAAAEKDVYVIIDECFMTLTGRELEYSAKRFIAEKTGQLSGVKIDESDIADEGSLLQDYKRLVIIDAFTKTFAIPGIRLGMAYFGDAELAAKIRKLLPEWNISCVAEAAGLEAVRILREYYYDEKNYITASIEFINKERDRMLSQLTDLSDRIKILPSDANYILLKTDIDLYEQMLSRRILIRDCSDYHGLGKGYYRISISTEKNNSDFMDELRELIK